MRMSGQSFSILLSAIIMKKKNTLQYYHLLLIGIVIVILISCGKDETPSLPAPIPEFYSAIAVGQTHAIALDQQGTLWAWGDDFFGELGNGKGGGIFIRVMTGTVFSAIAAGGSQCFAIEPDGTLWAWGWNIW